ncbi:peroxidasin homolog [Diabrotica virgifera virgifera]|uniref:Peroxidasin homolog n=1 Tax=Diabrotica virgifera virgifera TaxID=50390 RepID=A0A6P7F2B4_DIAVI|nr:peroxidasin homolog [Diabrotica virgifera virgifera]
MISKSLNLILLSVYLILHSSYGDGSTKDVQGGGWKDNRLHNTTTFIPDDPSYRAFRVVLGGTFGLPCNIEDAVDSKLNVSWSRIDGHPLPTNSSQRSGVLYIYNVEKEAQGEYKCSALDSNDRPVSDFKAYLMVMSPPKINLTATKLVVYPGGTAQVTCKATGDQPIKITWSPLAHNMSNSVYAKEGHMHFNNINYEHGGKFLCVAKNQAGEASAEVDVIVKDPPRIRFTLPITVVRAGKFMSIYCNTTGDPTARFSFKSRVRENQLVYNNEGYIYLDKNQFEDVGKHRCVAKNQAGTVEAFSDVTLIG